MKFIVSRTHEDIAVSDAHRKSQNMKWRLIALSLLSFLTGLLIWYLEMFPNAVVPFCVIVPFICLFSYREIRRKATNSVYLKANPDHNHLTGEMVIEIIDGKMSISYEKCEDSDLVTKREIQKVVLKYGYLFIHVKNNIISIPEFPEMKKLRQAILAM